MNMKDTITINDFFEIAKETDLKDLLDKSLHEPDPESGEYNNKLFIIKVNYFFTLEFTL